MPAALPDPSRTYQGPLYRALNPIHARTPLSGAGAALHGGRFNAKGKPALYTALSIMGAVAEANQIGRPFEPVTLVSYQADLGNLLDTDDYTHLAAHGINPQVLAADDWRLQMASRGKSASQDLGLHLAGLGYAGMIVPSFARGTAPGSRNLVLWQWDGLQVTDTEGRLK